MNLKVYSVYDSAVGQYMQPFFLQSRGQALRAFIDLSADASTNVGKYPSDFTLFELGEFNPENGKFENLPTPISLGTALELKTRVPASPDENANFLSKSKPRGLAAPERTM